MGVTAAIAIGSILIGGYTESVTSDARDEAFEQKKKTEEKQTALVAETKDREKVEEVTQQRSNARLRQRALASGTQGRSSTILTSPLGIPGGSGAGGQPAPGGKTLLGS